MPVGFHDTSQVGRSSESTNDKQGQQLQSKVTIVKAKRVRTTPDKIDETDPEDSVKQRKRSPVCKEATIDAISLLADAYAQDDEDESDSGD